MTFVIHRLNKTTSITLS